MREDGLGEQLLGAIRRLRHSASEATQQVGVSPHQVRALQMAALADGARLSELAERLRVAPRSATEVVDALEAKGLLARSPDPSDRRATLVRLTDQGRAVLNEAQALRRAAFEESLSVFTEEEKAQLSALLRKLDPDA